MADKLKDKVKFFLGLSSDEDEVATQQDFDSFNPHKGEELMETYRRPAAEYTTPATDYKDDLTICKYTPREFHEATKIINDIKQNKPVIINLEEIDSDGARKILDICTGAIYALEGEISKVSHNIFILAPKNVNVLAHLYEKEFDDEEDEE